MTIAEMISGMANKLTSTLSSINAALMNKGQTAALSMTEIPAKIEAITTGITPTGELSITTNKTYDVTNYASAKVNVPIPSGYIQPSGNKDITSNGTNIDVASYNTVSVDVPVPTGYVYPSTIKGAATITPGTQNQTIGAGTYISGAQTILGDEDLVAPNIKSGVNIFGVMGTYNGGGAKVFSTIMTADAYSDVFQFTITPNFSINTTTEKLLLLVIQKTKSTANNEIKMYTYDSNHDQFVIWYEDSSGDYEFDYYNYSDYNDDNAYITVSYSNGVPTVQVGVCVHSSTDSNYAGFVSGVNNQNDYYVTAIFG